jgi:thiol-disulfide isomerase/thioredoxin
MKSILYNYNLYKAFKSKRARAILLCLVSMFSLSAQTPRKDSGADGLPAVAAINVGDRVPEDVYTRQYKVYTNGKAVTTDLKHLKGKLVILDFWASWCGMCLTQMPKGEKLSQRYADTLAIVLVNTRHRRDDLQKIKKTYNETLSRIGGNLLPTVYDDEYLIRLFPHASIPRYVWISPRGTVLAITGHTYVNKEQIDNVIDLLRGQGNYD